MRGPMIGAALAMLLSTAAAAQLTEPGALAACKAGTLKDAADCLRTALSEGDRIALVAARPGARIRMQIDRRVQEEMRLGDAASPLSRWFARHGIKTATFRSAVVIDEYLANQRASSLDLAAIAAIEPPEGAMPKPIARIDTPRVLETPISIEECSRRTKLPETQIGECFLAGDKLLVSKRQKVIGDPDGD